MNDRITKLYVCCVDNKVVAFDTNFKGFYEQLNNIANCNSDRYYSKRFNELGEFNQWIEGSLYYFQRLV